MPIGFILSLLFALCRVSKYKLLSKPVAAYIFIIRGTPLLVQIYLIYFGLGSVKAIRESFLWIVLKEPFWCGVIALTINTVLMVVKFLEEEYNLLLKDKLNLVNH